MGLRAANSANRTASRASSAGCPRAIVAIPVRDEAERLARCLEALAKQQDPLGRPLPSGTHEVVLCLNNCRDSSRELVRRLASSLPLRIEVREVELPAAQAHVGWARRLAMNAAASRLLRGGRRADGVLLSTDADSEVVPTWLDATLRAIDAGADAVAGSIELDASEALALNPAARARLAAERRYEALLERLATLLDPEPHDPWPRHGYHCGASMAARVSTYLAVGGLPPEPVAEDRAFFRAVLQRDGRIRHCPAVRVITSCRVRGRAAGGMADRLLSWSGADRDRDVIDAALPAARTMALRSRLRQAWRQGRGSADLSSRLGLSRAELDPALARQTFGAAYQTLLERSPALRGSRLPGRHLPRELAHAAALVDRLTRRHPEMRDGRGRAGSDPQAASAA